MAVTQNSIALPFDQSQDESSFSGITKSGLGKYPNPFCDIASEYVPRDLNTIFEFAEYLYLTFGTYRTASRRVVRYFLTELDLEGESDNERKEFEDFLNDDLHIMQVLADIGDDFMVYGNVFVSIYFPFDRYLTCPSCGVAYHVSTIDYNFKPSAKAFYADCPGCGGQKLEFIHNDRRSPDKKGINIVRWNPKNMKIRVHPISGKMEYWMQLDKQFVQNLRDGKPFYLDQTPWSMIEAACDDSGGNKGELLFKFNDDAIYHFKDSSLAGIPIQGWAIPPIMPNFKQAYYIQLLRRYDEAIALDFTVPFRILYPEQNRGLQGNDPLQTMNMGNFVSHMKNLVEKKRKNITDIQVAPYQIGYELIGGEAQSLTPKDSIAQALDELLNAIGFPAELYKGSLTIQAFPVALRLFEKTWGALVGDMNDWLSWMMVRVSRHLMWGRGITGKLRSVTLADDIERKALSLQAAAGMDISKSTAYKPLGIDYMEEQRRVVEEQETIAALQQEAMERQQAMQMGMGTQPPAGGAEGGPGGSPGATPGDVHEQGKQLAQQLLFNTPDTQRRGELIKIKHSNPTLHAIVTQEMDNIRQELSSQGKTMLMQEAKTASADMEEAKSLPSPMAVGLLISDQVCGYNRGDLMKMAMQIKRGDTGAREAFHFVYGKTRGWI